MRQQKTEPNNRDLSHKLSALRLCVGSLITDILCCFTLTMFSCLHFGQYREVISIVSARIFVRVFDHKRDRLSIRIQIYSHLKNFRENSNA
jgi:hypothetical protein